MSPDSLCGTIPVADAQGMNGWMEFPWQQLGDDLNALGKKGEGFELQ